MNRFEFINNNDDIGVTVIENMFINHFMPMARGDYVKVYLYGLKCTQNAIDNMPSNRKIANTLGMSEADVVKAFKYWHEKQVITFMHTDKRNYVIQYKNISTMIFTPEKFKKNGSYSETIEYNTKKQNLFDDLSAEFEATQEDGGLGRPISHQEMEMFSDWMEEYSFSAETVKLIVNTCLVKRKIKQRKYWNAVAMDFHSKGIKTFDEAVMEFNKSDKRYQEYQQIFKYLGLNTRGSFITKPEETMVDKWIDEYKLSMEQILRACDETISTNKPSFKYVDRVIYNMYINTNKDTKPTSNKYAKTQNSTKKETIQSELDYEYYSEEEIERIMNGE
ncbi:DnaD domain protein [Anaerofustis sp.]|uniref:DnaD domain-containing protein n=1 Tax=Anaerofustis sp. TaxID=1872517 RepID=UPI0025BF3170|nr:DnaD domain protein [Anaerofustis sp.]